jgi:N-ethylmaleimide reductase
MVTYYSQRASRGLLMLTEATPVSITGHGYPCTPGLHTPEQVRGRLCASARQHSSPPAVLAPSWRRLYRLSVAAV